MPTLSDSPQLFYLKTGRLGCSREVVANCVDVHDVAVTKLVAGREKDFDFLSEMFSRELISDSEFLARIELVHSQVENDALRDRLVKLLVVMRRSGLPVNLIDSVQGYISKRAGKL
jgi:hypothetical protein